MAEVPELILMVSEKFPKIVVDYEFVDERFRYNAARYTFIAGEIIAEYAPADNTIESRHLAKSILDWESWENFDDDTDNTT